MFNGIKPFIATFGILNLITHSFFTVFVSQISNIEKAFGLSSSETGWLLTIWEIGYAISTVIASYFGPRAHIPRVIGTVTVLFGLTGFVIALPHFIAFSAKDVIIDDKQNETFENNITDINLYVNTTRSFNKTTSESSDITHARVAKGSSKTIAYALFSIGMILQGALEAPCYPYSAKYVDDNVDKQKTGFYLGVISSITVFGLALGYGLGSLISGFYVTLQSTPLSSTDTRYIGAWWLGCIVIGLASILSAIPMFCFPRKLTSNNSEALHQHDQHRYQPHNSVLTEMKRVVSTLFAIIKSCVYVLTLAAACLQILSFSVFLGFEPKYMETQFAIPQWQVNIVIGVISIISYSLGCLIGGYITKKWDMSPYKTLLLIISLVGIVTAILVGAAFLGCGHQDIYNSPTEQSHLSDRLGCDYNATEFLPVCGEDGKIYFSPCHAGCTVLTESKFANCSAIPGGKAIMGLCSSRCNMVWIYSCTKFIMNLVDAIASIPIFLVFLRSAGEKHKTLAFGLFAAISSVTGLRIAALLFLGAALFKAKSLPHWPKEETTQYELVNTH